jgi:di/tricarboxylate transporter
MKNKLIATVFTILSITIGFGLPYLIQFKLNFFGATLVSIGDIVKLWVIIPVITFIVMSLLYLKFLINRR